MKAACIWLSKMIPKSLYFKFSTDKIVKIIPQDFRETRTFVPDCQMPSISICYYIIVKIVALEIIYLFIEGNLVQPNTAFQQVPPHYTIILTLTITVVLNGTGSGVTGEMEKNLLH